MFKACDLTLGAALFLATGARAGVYIEMSEHDVASGKMTQHDKLYAQQGLLRADTRDGHTSVIFKDDAMYMLDASNKTYRVLDKAAMDQMAGKVNDMMSAMQAKMASMPPEQRAAMERAMQGMGQSMPGGAAPKVHTFDAVDTGASGTAGGRSCHMWNTLRDGKPSEQLCVVPQNSLPGMGEVLTAIKKAAAINLQFQEAMQARGGAVGAIASNTGGMMAQSMKVMEKIGGLPVATRHFDATTGELASTETVMTQWEQRSLDAAQFEIPPGYTRKEFTEGRKP
ncbi:MAG: hypothetical protein ACHQIL_08685 [Steroidobacterales bacterium]